jgi:hypothetical protein
MPDDAVDRILPGRGAGRGGGFCNRACPHCLVGWWSGNLGAKPGTPRPNCWVCGKKGKPITGWGVFMERHTYRSHNP